MPTPLAYGSAAKPSQFRPRRVVNRWYSVRLDLEKTLTPSSHPSKGPSDRQKGDIDAFTTVFYSQSFAISVHEILVEGGTEVNTSRESRHELLASDAVGSIRKTEGWNAQT